MKNYYEMPLLIEDQDYYQDGDRIIFTAAFHVKRGSCCGNGCRHCPYDPKYTKGNTHLYDTKDRPLPGRPEDTDYYDPGL